MSYREGHNFSLNNSFESDEFFKEYQSIDFSNTSFQRLSEIWNETLNSGMHGICFSLYEDGQKPGDIITAEQVNRRVQILKPYAKWIRSFSCLEGNENIPRIAHQNGIKTLVGAWLGDDLELNEKEIEGLLKIKWWNWKMNCRVACHSCR